MRRRHELRVTRRARTLPENFVELGVPELWPVTPAEYVSLGDVGTIGDDC